MWIIGLWGWISLLCLRPSYFSWFSGNLNLNAWCWCKFFSPTFTSNLNLPNNFCFSLKNPLFCIFWFFDCFHFHSFAQSRHLTQHNIFTDSGTAISCLDKKCKRISFSFPVKLQWFRQYQTFLDNILQSQIISDKGSQSLWVSVNLYDHQKSVKDQDRRALNILRFWIGWQVRLSLANHIANLSDFHGKIVWKTRTHCSRVCAICHDGRANFLLLQNMLCACKSSTSNDPGIFFYSKSQYE